MRRRYRAAVGSRYRCDWVLELCNVELLHEVGEAATDASVTVDDGVDVEPERPARVREVQLVVELEDRAVDGPLVRWHAAHAAQELPLAATGAAAGVGVPTLRAPQHEHPVALVAARRVRRCVVHVPPPVDVVELWGPELRGVVGVGWWSPALGGLSWSASSFLFLAAFPPPLGGVHSPGGILAGKWRVIVPDYVSISRVF